VEKRMIYMQMNTVFVLVRDVIVKKKKKRMINYGELQGELLFYSGLNNIDMSPNHDGACISKYNSK
tara:strand:- start:837 stop:1034 length:198 start_codon:yes stop_codon:yes gene_type:complete